MPDSLFPFDGFGFPEVTREDTSTGEEGVGVMESHRPLGGAGAREGRATGLGRGGAQQYGRMV